MPLRIFFTMNNGMNGRWNDGNNASIMQSLCTFYTVVGSIGEYIAYFLFFICWY
jgi:hypothetical protein